MSQEDYVFLFFFFFPTKKNNKSQPKYINCGEKSCIVPYTSARKSQISKINTYTGFFLGLLHPAFPRLSITLGICT